MKCLVFFLLFFLILINPTRSIGSNNQADQDKYKILSSPKVYPLTKEWIRKYNGLKPGTELNTEIKELNQPFTANHLYFLNESDPLLQKDSLWKMIIGREAIVPVINLKNPLLDKILKHGINAQQMHQLLTEGKLTWGTLLEDEINLPVQIFISGDSLVFSKLAAFSQVSPSTLKDKVNFVKDQDLAPIRENTDAIEFCRLSDVINKTSNQFIEGLTILPIDKNRNHRIDSFEKIYDTPESFTRGIWIGKYPAILCGNIYAVASSKPSDKNILELLTWIQKGGQDYLGSEGYSTLANTQRNSNLEELKHYQLLANKQRNTNYTRIFTAILLTTFVIAGYFLFIRRRKKIPVLRGNKTLIPVLNESSLLAPKGLWFDKSHTWAFMEAEGTVKIGIDDFMQHLTGELTHVILKEPGTEIRKGEKIITLSHKGKKLNIHAPVSGIVKERNKSLLFDPTLINSSPYKEGWIYVIEPKNWIKENHFLFMWEKYSEWLTDEIVRVKDFFASKMSSLNSSSQLVLQDGGEIMDNALSDLDPEIWEDFQEQFIDRSR